jgi:hypothetical protein
MAMDFGDRTIFHLSIPFLVGWLRSIPLA